VDLRPKNLTGREAEKALDAVGITVNKNLIPFDTQKPLITSGIRIGTPAVTTRGMGEREMEEIAALIAETLADVAPALATTAPADLTVALINEQFARRGETEAQRGILQRVHQLADRFPLYT